jgi:hypothetical protein
VYGDLLSGPRLAAPPARRPPGAAPLTTREPEGLAALLAGIARLQEGYVTFIHRAHGDLKQRAGQLRREAGSHEAALPPLAALAGRVLARQAELGARLERAAGVQANLSERLALLASLHWGAPRPLSAAEGELRAQLGAWEHGAAALADAWSALSRRVEAACEGQRARAPPPGAPAAALPAAQLARVHGCLREQQALMADAMRRLGRVEGRLRLREAAALAAALTEGPPRAAFSQPPSSSSPQQQARA